MNRTSDSEQNKPRTFGPELRKRRKAEGWSLEDLHRESGVSKTYIQTLETEKQPKNGLKPHPSMDKIRLLANALKWKEETAVALAFQTFFVNAPASEEESAVPFDRPRLRIEYPDGQEEEVVEGKLYDLFFNLKHALDEK